MALSTSHRRWWLPVGLLALVLLSYAPILRAFFLSDDYVLLTEAQLRSLAEALAIDHTWFFYRPLGKLLWWCEFRLFGYHAALYHMVSLGLHALCALLVVLLARRLLAGRAALLAGCAFALLPLHAEPVAWLACQYDLLMTAGFLAATLALLRFLEGERARLGWLLGLLLAFQLSLWAKESALVFPVLGPLLAWVVLPRLSLRRMAVATLPCWALLVVNLLQRAQAWGSLGGYGDRPILWPQLPMTLAQTALTLLAPLNRLVFPGWALLLWGGMSLLLLAMAALCGRRLWLAALLWLACTLAPALGLLPVGADMQNSRVLYLPSVGLCLLLAAGAGVLSARLPRRAGLAAGGAASLGMLATMLWQLGPWQVAGQNSLHVVQELHRLLPKIPPASRVQTAGLPDNYQGAYVYRLGLNHAFGHLFQSTFALDSVASIGPLSYDVAGYDTQVVFGLDAAAQRWGIAQLRYASPGPLPEVDGQVRWDLSTCPAGWAGDTACAVGAGFRAGPALVLASPRVAAQPPGWRELAAELDLPPAPQGAALVFEWRAGEGTWQSTGAAQFNLPPQGGRYRFHLMLGPADQGAQPPDQLRVRVDGLPGAVVRAVALRVVP